jgi:hypothetical protein
MNSQNTISNMYKIVNTAATTKGQLNNKEIIKLIQSIITEIEKLSNDNELTKSEFIPKRLLSMIMEKSNDFEDFKEKYKKFSEIDSNNKNYNKKMNSYVKNVLKININNE